MSPKVDDIVEIQYPRSPSWNGMQFRVEEYGTYYYKGVVTKTNSHQTSVYPVGSVFTWGIGEGVTVVDEDFNRQGILF